MQTEKETIVVPTEVAEWERSCRLPDLTGSARQVAWGRVIRHEFLSALFGIVMDATGGMDAGQAKSAYGTLDEIRAENRAQLWIEGYRHYLDDPVGLLLRRTAARAAEAQARADAEERHRRAAEHRRIAREATKWEKRHRLPPLHGVSPKQVNYGRRCRYELCINHPEEALPHHRTAAKFWIDHYLETQQMDGAEERYRTRDFDRALAKDGDDEGVVPVRDGDQYIGGIRQPEGRRADHESGEQDARRVA